ncbi:conserved exported protein of unknown function [Vibrio tapetis subsp. tapetis]|uniref:Beta-lactamase-related domain-containing protein n=2 Tax=Vibrio tapetis TaxID=52443 RepID=A0A2N8Z8M1_9VIBR|nr:conserved exported protein of unknown function [Vibrio tapetis subsp. tapetis]
MNKNLLAVLVGIGLSFGTTAAEFAPADQEFLGHSAQMTITPENWDSAEYAATSFPNAYKYTNHYHISRGLLGSEEPTLSPEVLEQGSQLDFDAIQVTDVNDSMSLNTFLRDRLKNHSMVVLKDNKIMHEHYWNNMDEHSTHLDMSVTKSFTSMLAAIAVAEGKLDMSKKVIDYLPELKNTAWESATVQEVADMRTSLTIVATPHKSWDDRMTRSQSWNGDESKAFPNGVADYMQLVKEVSAPMGSKYSYQCINTEVLGKVVEKATGENLADYLESRIWKKVGMENDAYFMSDATGFPVASGGLNATTKDLARMGKVLLNNGKNYVGEEVIPEKFIDGLLEGNDEVRSAWKKSKEAALADGWYKDQFRVLQIPGRKIIAMVGIHGQVVAMDKETGTVVAMNGGYPQTETPRMAIMIFYKALPAIFDAVNKA